MPSTRHCGLGANDGGPGADCFATAGWSYESLGVPLAFIPVVVALPATMAKTASAVVQPATDNALAQEGLFETMADSGECAHLIWPHR